MATRLERINKQLQQLEEQKKVLLARERERERKADTRRKILIGAGLIEYARKDSMAGGILSIVIQGLREGGRNRELFDGWQPTLIGNRPSVLGSHRLAPLRIRAHR